MRFSAIRILGRNLTGLDFLYSAVVKFPSVGYYVHFALMQNEPKDQEENKLRTLSCHS